MESRALLRLSKTPTEYTNVFGVAYRYLRYLGTRKRIKATTTKQYGRLSAQELPKGELSERSDRERRQTFLKWLQDPEKVIYDDALAKSWRSYNEKKQAMDDERGRIAQLLFGEPRKNYEDARAHLLTSVSMYLYNRWKSEAQGNLKALVQFLREHADSRQLLRISEIKDPRAFAEALAADRVLGPLFRERFSHEGKKLLNIRGLRDKSDGYLRHQLTAEINLALTDERLSDLIDDTLLSTRVKTMLAERRSDVAVNRQILDDRYSSHLGGQEVVVPSAQPRDVTVLDVLVDDALREDFVTECENLLLFDSVYDQIIEHLDTIAEEAESTRALSKRTITKLLDTTLAQAARAAVNGNAGTASGEAVVERLRGQFFRWFLRVADTPRSTDFFRAVEEWKKTSFPHLSDTLFVVVTFLFERLLGMHLQSEKDRRRYDGRISPRAIGRRKDFWNRLTIAYRDLRIQEVVEEYKGRKSTGYRALIDTFFTDFEELYSDLLSSDPCEFPGFRISIESALKAKIPPCGIVTGIGTFNDGAGGFRVGVVISNLEFQAGAFDMASAEKFCKLLVDCAERQLPVIAFISSGGMQTKEGAGALFPMAVLNDRITRFVRESGLARDLLRFRRLYRRRAGQLRHASAGADVLLLRHQHAVRRTDRGPANLP